MNQNITCTSLLISPCWSLWNPWRKKSWDPACHACQNDNLAECSGLLLTATHSQSPRNKVGTPARSKCFSWSNGCTGILERDGKCLCRKFSTADLSLWSIVGNSINVQRICGIVGDVEECDGSAVLGIDRLRRISSGIAGRHWLVWGTWTAHHMVGHR